jgi:hypothetical protein
MKVEPLIVDDCVAVYREDEPEDRCMEAEMAMEFDPSAHVPVLSDHPQLTEVVIEINPEADAYALLQTIAIY